MKRITLLLLLLVGCVSASLHASTPTSTSTITQTYTATYTITTTFTATPSTTATPTITLTPTAILTNTPIASLDGQKGRVTTWPKQVVLSDRVTAPLTTPATTPDDPYILNVNGHTGVAWALSTTTGYVQMQVPADYKAQPSLWAYCSTTVSAGLALTVNMKVNAEVAHMGSPGAVSYFAGTSTNIALVTYPGSLNGSSMTGAVRLQLPLPGYGVTVTYTPYATGLLVPGALKPGDTIAFGINRLSQGLNLRFLRFDFEYAKNAGLNP